MHSYQQQQQQQQQLQYFVSQQFMNCVVVTEEDLLCNGTEYHLADHKVTPEDTMFWMYLLIYALLVLGAGLMSGLTIGLLSLDLLSLKVLSDSGTGETKRYAQRLFPIIRRHHWLLVTLLLGNAACVEAMPIFLDRVSDPVTAILVSVTAVLFFGEVIPQALCTRYGLKIGYYCSPFVYVCMVVMSPISFPIAKLLDCVLGADHETVFKREELKSLVSFHGPEVRVVGGVATAARQHRANSTAAASASASAEAAAADEDAHHRRTVLTRDEVTIIRGALELTSVTAGDVCTPIEQVFMLSDRCALDAETRRSLVQSAHSRVPVHHGDDRHDIRGHLLVKMLLVYDPGDRTPLEELLANRRCFREMPFVKASAALYDLLKIFQQGKSHMAVVLKSEQTTAVEVQGVITLENVLERLLLESIRDEADELRDFTDEGEGEGKESEEEEEVNVSFRRRSVRRRSSGTSSGAGRAVRGQHHVSREVSSVTVTAAKRHGAAAAAGEGGGECLEVRTTKDTERTPLLMGQRIQ